MENIRLKIGKYQKNLSVYIEGLAHEYNNALGNEMTYQPIIDTKHNHFQLVIMGWVGNKFIYEVLIHLDIHPETGNIWVQQNNTEILIDEDLEGYDIPKKHFVLGFRPASVRPHSKYAVM